MTSRLETASQLTGDEITQLLHQEVNTFRELIKQTPDFPQPGILFEDIFPIFTSPRHHESLIRAYELQILALNLQPDIIIGLDARGFLLAPTLALRANCSFVPVRKAGKLPGRLQTVSYAKEYGADSFAVQDGAIPKGAKVLVVDDLIATGGSAAAAGELVKMAGGVVVGYIFIIELVGLNGRDRLEAPVHSLIQSQA